MKVEIKFLRLTKPAALGDRIDGWRVARLGPMPGVFVVMVGSDENAIAENQDSLNIHVPVYRRTRPSSLRDHTEWRRARWVR
jgi:hypothetical protein